MTMSDSPTDQDVHESPVANLRNRESRQPFLQQTLPGEFLSLALILHAVFGSLFWATWSLGAPQGLLMVTAGVWIVIRAIGIFARRAFAPPITGGLIFAILVSQQYVELTSPFLLFFSPTVFVAMLATVLCSDLADLLASSWGNRLLSGARSHNWYRIAIWGFGVIFLVYMVLIPTAAFVVEVILPSDPAAAYKDKMSLGERVRLRSMEAMTGFMFFALGATIGSFLNVVVFRMPRGESVVFRPSRCPKCETEIKGRDNVPIFGWLLLNGRCRACEVPISSRYPIVESIMATIFLLLFFVELISGGANIPVRKPNFYRGVVWVIFYTKWDLIGIYFFHCFTLCTLLTWTLVDVDRQRIPWWAKWFTGGILLALPALMPDLLPVPWQVREYGFQENWNTVLLTSAFGGICGAALAVIVWFAIRTSNPPGEPYGHFISASIIAGVSVGWQAVVGIWIIALALRPVISWASNRWRAKLPPPITAVWLLAFLVHLVFWRLLTVRWWPSYETTTVAWIAWTIGFLALCLANRWAVILHNAQADTQPLPPTLEVGIETPNQ